MGHTIAEIAAAIGLVYEGAGDLVVHAVAEPAQAGPGDLALAAKPEYADGLTAGQAQAAMMWQGADWQSYGLKAAILAPRPRYAMAGLSALMDAGQHYPSGIDPSAYIDPTAMVARDVSIGAFAYVGPDAHIGPGTVLAPHCFVGAGSSLGANGLLHAGVRILARVTIGDRFVAHPGVVIGADGFSFVTPEPSAVEVVRDTLGEENSDKKQAWARIHSLGGVEIGDDVEIGANSCVDRGTVRNTVIGNGVKFDNLVQIGHNVVIGNDCLICAQVGVAGSTVIGHNVVLGGQTGVSDNLTIGDNVITGGGTKVLSKVGKGKVMLGYPATRMDAQLEQYKALRRLPRLFRDVAALKKAVSKFGGTD